MQNLRRRFLFQLYYIEWIFQLSRDLRISVDSAASAKLSGVLHIFYKTLWAEMDASGSQDEGDKPHHRPFLIGVSGGTASGKVRFVFFLIQQLASRLA